MFSRSKVFLISLVLILAIFSACSSSSGANSSADGEQVGSDQSGGGVATVHYQYLMKHPDANHSIDFVLPVEVEPGSSPGSYQVSGIREVNVQFSMGANIETERCAWHCNIDLIFVAEGQITLDENTGKCIIPMRFTFTPAADQWILESDCPPELEAAFNCSTLSVHLLDPSVYTFEANKRTVTIPTETGVTLKAELKNFSMPAEVEGVCNW